MFSERILSSVIKFELQMISIGLVGMNEGNGHPYSYSAMFNGFNERFLAEECEFDLIKKYLPRDHKNKSLIQRLIVL